MLDDVAGQLRSPDMEIDRRFAAYARANYKLFLATNQLESILSFSSKGLSLRDFKAAVSHAFAEWLSENLSQMDHLAGAKPEEGASILDKRPHAPGDERRFAYASEVALGERSRVRCDIASKILNLLGRASAPPSAMERVLDKGLIPSFDNALSADMRGPGAEQLHIRLLQAANLPESAMEHVVREALWLGNPAKLRAAEQMGGKPTVDHIAICIRRMGSNMRAIDAWKAALAVREKHDERVQGILFDIEAVESEYAERMETILYAANEVDGAPGLTADDVQNLVSMPEASSRPRGRDEFDFFMKAIVQAIEDRSEASRSLRIS